MMSKTLTILFLLLSLFPVRLFAQNRLLEKAELRYGRVSEAPKGWTEMNYLTNNNLLVTFIDGLRYELRVHNNKMDVENSFVFDLKKYCKEKGFKYYNHFFFNDFYYFIIKDLYVETGLRFLYFKIDCNNPTLDIELIDLWSIPRLDCRTCEKVDITISPNKKYFALGHHSLSAESSSSADTRIYFYESNLFDEKGNMVRRSSIDLKEFRKAMPRKHFILDNLGNQYWATTKAEQFYFSGMNDTAIHSMDLFESLSPLVPKLKSLLTLRVMNFNKKIQLISMYSDDHRNETKGVLVSEILPDKLEIEPLVKIDFDQKLVDRLEQTSIKELDLVTEAGEDDTPTMHKMALMEPVVTDKSIFLITQFQHYTFRVSYSGGANAYGRAIRKNSDYIILSLDFDFSLKKTFQIPFLGIIECEALDCGRLYSRRISSDHSLTVSNDGINIYMLNNRENYSLPLSDLNTRIALPRFGDKLGFYKISIFDDNEMETQLLGVLNDKYEFSPLFNSGMVNQNGNLTYFSRSKKEYKLVELID